MKFRFVLRAVHFAMCAALPLAAIFLTCRVADAQAPAPAPAPEVKKPYLTLMGSLDQDLVKDRRARNRLKNLVTFICKGQKPLKDEQTDNTQEFEHYFKRYLFPMMTHPDELGNIASMRQELMREYFMAMKNDVAGLELRDRLNKLTLFYMTNFCKSLERGEFHPAVRYNAMLIIGDLDSRGPETFNPVTPSDPLPAALDVMVTELKSERQIDAVKVAALVGIARHAELNRYRPVSRRLLDQHIKTVKTPLQEIAAMKEPPPGRSAQGHHWMRRLAVEALSHLASAQPVGPETMAEIAGVINDIVGDQKEPLALRCTAAEAQGRLLNPLAKGQTAESEAKQLGRLAMDCIIAELGSLRPFIDELKSRTKEPFDGGRGFGGGAPVGGGGLGILGGAAAGPAGANDVPSNVAPKIVATQRRLKHRLGSVSGGLFGVDGGPGLMAGVRDADTKAKMDKVRAALDGALEAVDAPPPGDPPLAEQVQDFYRALADQGSAIRDLTPEEKATPAPPVTEPGPGPGPGPSTGTPEPVATGPETVGPGVSP